MEAEKVIDSIKQMAAKVLPKGSVLYLYGSRARDDAREDSDWDMLLLLDKPQIEQDDFKKYSYPIMVMGFELWQMFNIQAYTKAQWFAPPHAMYYYNVEKDKKLLYES